MAVRNLLLLNEDNSANSVIKNAIKYIDKNFNKDISLHIYLASGVLYFTVFPWGNTLIFFKYNSKIICIIISRYKFTGVIRAVRHFKTTFLPCI